MSRQPAASFPHTCRASNRLSIPGPDLRLLPHAAQVRGEDVSEPLDIVPAQFRVIVTRRSKYGCRTCKEDLVQAPASTRLIEGGIRTRVAVAHILISKYADHMPLYRQPQIYVRQGVNQNCSKLADCVGKAAFQQRSAHVRLCERLKASIMLFADDATAWCSTPAAA